MRSSSAKVTSFVCVQDTCRVCTVEKLVEELLPFNVVFIHPVFLVHEIDHIGECSGKLAEHLGDVRKLPPNHLARHGSPNKAVAPIHAWVVYITIQAKGDLV